MFCSCSYVFCVTGAQIDWALIHIAFSTVLNLCAHNLYLPSRRVGGGGPTFLGVPSSSFVCLFTFDVSVRPYHSSYTPWCFSPRLLNSTCFAVFFFSFEAVFLLFDCKRLYKTFSLFYYSPCSTYETVVFPVSILS